MKRVLVIGAGDLGAQLAHHAAATPDLRVVGFCDDVQPRGTLVSGAPVMGGLDDVLPLYARQAFDELLIGIGYKHLPFRNALFERLSPHIPFARLVHPSAWVDPTCVIEPGAVVYPGCILDMHAHVGANTLLNVGCVIAHHTSIGPGCFLSPAVKVAGFVRVESGCVLGIQTVVIDNITIASGVRTGAGAVVVKDIAEPGLYIGVPAARKQQGTLL